MNELKKGITAKAGITGAPILDFNEPIGCRPNPKDEDFECPKCGCYNTTFWMNKLSFECKDCDKKWKWENELKWKLSDDGKKWLLWRDKR
jgi:hypothetical protein